MKAKDLYDIAIIGTGPAGATLARLLHPKYKIIAIDKKNPHGDGFQKPCGGLICTDAQKALASFDLTLPKDVLVDPQIFAVKTIDLKNKLIRHYQRFYINMDRHKFDLWLESLLPKTVELHSNAVCTELKQENGGFLISYQDLQTKQIRTVRAKFLVGADGANSIVRRTFYPEKKLRRYLSIQQWFPETHLNPFYSCILIRKQQIAVRGRFPRIISLFSAVPFLWIMPGNALNGKRQSWRKSGFVSARP